MSNPISIIPTKTSVINNARPAATQSRWLVVAMIIANAVTLGGIVALGNMGILTIQSALIVGACAVVGSICVSTIVCIVIANRKRNITVTTSQSSNPRKNRPTSSSEGPNIKNSVTNSVLPSSSHEMKAPTAYSEECISAVRSTLSPEDIAEIRKLQKLENIHFIDAAFITSANRGRIEVITFLIQNGTKVDVSTKSGTTPIMLATFGGHSELVELLLKHHANVDATDGNGVNALMIAASKGFIEIAQLLVTHHASVNAADEYGKNPLMIAAVKGFVEFALFLMKHGVDVDSVDNEGHTALMKIARISNQNISEEHHDLFKILIKKANVNAIDRKGKTALIYAVSRGNTEIAQLLIEHGADADVINENGENPLMLAAANGFVGIVQLLVNKVDVNAIDGQCRTALMKVCKEDISEKHVQIAKILIEQKAAVDATDKYGKTALIYTASKGKGHFEIAKLLIENGASVDIITLKGKTALIEAASEGCTEMAELFIESGAGINVTDQSKRTPLMWAVFKGHIETVALFIKKDALINTRPDKKGHNALMCAVYHDHFEIARLLLEHRAEIAPDHPKCKGKNALMIAAIKSDVKMCKLLVSHEAKIDTLDKDGKNALMHALSGDSDNKSSIVDFLINQQSNVEVKDEYGRTPLMHAVSYPGNEHSINSLLLKKADINAVDKDGKTPYMYAALQNHPEYFEILESKGADLEARDNKGRSAGDYRKIREKKALVDALESEYLGDSIYHDQIKVLKEEIKQFLLGVGVEQVGRDPTAVPR